LETTEDGNIVTLKD